MRRFTFAALVTTSALCAGAALAQTATPAPAEQPGSASARAGKPANLCDELLAFIHPPAPASAAAPTSGPAAAAQPSPQAATAVTAPAQSAPAPQPSSSGGAPQQSSSLSGQVTPSGPGASGPQGAAQPGAGGPPPADAAKPPAQAAAAPAQPAAPAQAAAPAAPAAPPPPKPTAAQIEKVETAQRDHNLQGCRDAAQEMRRAGIVIPPPLLALAALDLKFFDTNQKQ